MREPRKSVAPKMQLSAEFDKVFVTEIKNWMLSPEAFENREKLASLCGAVLAKMISDGAEQGEMDKSIWDYLCAKKN